MDKQNDCAVCVKMTTLKGMRKKIPVMSVNIKGTPSLPEILQLMGDIKNASNEIKGEYISITDFRKLEINKLFQSIIVFGMESAYSSLLSVKNAAKLSFVIFRPSQVGEYTMQTNLEKINESQNPNPKKYNYIFVRSIVEALDTAAIRLRT